MTASRRLLYGETSRMHYSGVILAHSSTQIVFKSWRFHGPLLWTLIFSSLVQSSIGFKSGDWLAILVAVLSFSETNWEFPWLCVWDHCLGGNVHPHFIFIILVDGSRFLSRMSRYIFPIILPSTIWILPVLHHDVLGWMCSAIWPPNMVCIVASKE